MLDELKTTYLNHGTGLINDIDEATPWADELGLLGDIDLPKEFKVDGLDFPKDLKLTGMEYEYQLNTMTCVANATTTMAEHYLHETTGEVHKFSQVHLFFQSGGNSRGSNIKYNLETARTKGCIPYAKMPLPENAVRDWWFIDERNKALAIPFDNAYKIAGYTKIKGDWNSLKTALYLYKRPIMVAVRIAGNYYTDMDWLGSGGMSNHVLLLVGWDSFNRPVMFDTLRYVQKSNGYRTFGAGYEFPMGYMVHDLGADWKKMLEKKRTEFAHCLNHYGKPRRFADEQKNTQMIQDSFRKFKNQSVYEAAGRFWTVMINAYTYGGYSMTDLWNNIYYWRRNGEHVFNFDKERHEYFGKIM